MLYVGRLTLSLANARHTKKVRRKKVRRTSDRRAFSGWGVLGGQGCWDEVDPSHARKDEDPLHRGL